MQEFFGDGGGVAEFNVFGCVLLYGVEAIGPGVAVAAAAGGASEDDSGSPGRVFIGSNGGEGEDSSLVTMYLAVFVVPGKALFSFEKGGPVKLAEQGFEDGVSWPVDGSHVVGPLSSQAGHRSFVGGWMERETTDQTEVPEE